MDKITRARFVKAAGDLLTIMRTNNIEHVSLFPRPGDSEDSCYLQGNEERDAPDGYRVSAGEAWDQLAARRLADASMEEYGPRTTRR